MASVYAFTSLQACVQSATLPAVTEYSDRHTSASTARCILELSPFCAAHVPISPSRTCGVWMHFNMACICHQPFKVRICDKNFEQHLPFTLIFPAAKPAMGVFTISIVWRKVSPGSTCAQDPKYGIEKRRLSRAVTPRVPFRPERWSSKSAHTLSDMSCRRCAGCIFPPFYRRIHKNFS